MDEVTDELLKLVTQCYSTTGSIDNNLLTALNFLYPNCLLHVLDLVDRKKVVKYVSDSGRSLYEVVGSAGVPYLCLLEGNFCECPAFKFSALKSGEQTTCKHLLAIRVALATSTNHELDNKEDLDHNTITSTNNNNSTNISTNNLTSNNKIDNNKTNSLRVVRVDESKMTALLKSVD